MILNSSIFSFMKFWEKLNTKDIYNICRRWRNWDQTFHMKKYNVFDIQKMLQPGYRKHYFFWHNLCHIYLTHIHKNLMAYFFWHKRYWCETMIYVDNISNDSSLIHAFTRLRKVGGCLQKMSSKYFSDKLFLFQMAH